MFEPILQQETDRRVGMTGGASGSELNEGAWEMIVLPREGQPPLRFKGRRLTRHWRVLGAETIIFIELWQRRAGGVVVAHSDCRAQKIVTQCTRFADLNVAVEHLEARCADQPDTLAVTGEPVSIFSDLIHHMAFSQHFAQLVGETLAVWCDMPQLRKDRS